MVRGGSGGRVPASWGGPVPLRAILYVEEPPAPPPWTRGAPQPLRDLGERLSELQASLELLEGRLRLALYDVACTLGWRADAGQVTEARAQQVGGQFARASAALGVAGDAVTEFARSCSRLTARLDVLFVERRRIVDTTELTCVLGVVGSVEPDPLQLGTLREDVARVDREIDACCEELRACDARAAGLLGDACLTLRDLARLGREDGWVSTTTTGAVLDVLRHHGVALSAQARDVLVAAENLAADRGGEERLRGLLGALPVEEVASLLVSHPDLAARLLGPLPTAPDPAVPSARWAAGDLRGTVGRAADLAALLARRPGATPRAFVDTVIRWFTALDPDETRMLALLYPAVVGNLDGAPLRDRVAANRVHLAVALDAERHRLTDLVAAARSGNGTPVRSRLPERWGDAVDLLVRLEDPRAALRRAQDRVSLYESLLNERVDNPAPAQGRPRTVERQVLLFDPRGDGRVAEMWGVVDAHTRHVAVLVPGTGACMDTFAGYSQKMRWLARDVPFGRATTIAWMGLDLPDAVVANAPDPAYAEAGGPALRDFLRGLALPEGVDTTAVGHSYGGAVVGVADRVGLEVDRVLHVASAGAGRGVFSAADYEREVPGRVVDRYTMTAPGDLVEAAHVGRGLQDRTGLGHGGDPDDMPCFRRLETGRVEEPGAGEGPGEMIRGAGAHSLVLEPHTTAWRNLVGVVTGGEIVPHTAPTVRYGYVVDDGALGPVERLREIRVYPYEDPAYPGTPPVDIR